MSTGSIGSSSPSHLATTTLATALPTTLVAERPMSRKWSTARISSKPASGMLNCASAAGSTTRLAGGPPAPPAALVGEVVDRQDQQQASFRDVELRERRRDHH